MGTTIYAHRFISTIKAASKSGSVRSTSTMMGWPRILIQRLKATNMKSDQKMARKQ